MNVYCYWHALILETPHYLYQMYMDPKKEEEDKRKTMLQKNMIMVYIEFRDVSMVNKMYVCC